MIHLLLASSTFQGALFPYIEETLEIKIWMLGMLIVTEFY